MNLRKLVGRTALAFVTTSLAASVILQAETGGSSCSDAGGSRSCSGSDRACCIYGADSTGQLYNVKMCCSGKQDCKVIYKDGTVGSGGVSPSRKVEKAGCL
jgi:hypothetical protein